MCKKPQGALAERVLLCRGKAAKKREGKGESFRFQFAMNMDAEGMDLLLKGIKALLLEQGAEEKVAPAPRGSLERDAQRLLDAYKKA